MVQVRRFAENPLLVPGQVRPSREDFVVTGVFNTGAFEYKGRFGLLLRVAEMAVQDDPAVLRVPYTDFSGRRPKMAFQCFRRDDPALNFSDTRGVWYKDGSAKPWITNISHLRLAWSDDGRRWRLEQRPCLVPADKYEAFGIEDPRITFLEGRYLITYSAISRHGVTSNLITTRDWKTFRRHGPLFVPDNKDICIFPAKVRGRYVALHRPSTSMLGKPDLWIAFSEDLIHWGGHECIMQTRAGEWDSGRIGCGPPPIRTKHGWLEVYHGSDDRNYYLGAMLMDLKDPRKVLARSREPILAPETAYEKEGFFANVVFANGQILRPGGTLWIYYGGADACTAGGEITVGELLGSLEG